MYPIISCYDVVSNVGLRDDMCCPPVPEYLLCCSYSKFKPGSSTKVSINLEELPFSDSVHMWASDQGPTGKVREG